MSALRDILGAVVVVATIGAGYVLADNAGEYVAPTTAEIEADIQIQRTNLCGADGWPDDADSKLAFQRACRGDLVPPN
jgi:hypothetical protein